MDIDIAAIEKRAAVQNMRDPIAVADAWTDRNELLAERAELIEAAKLPQAAADVLAERRRQVEVEGWTPEHDDEHTHGELAGAAACYAYGEMIRPDTGAILWHWDEEWWKPSDRRRELVKAGALILAEIDRLDRARGEKVEESRT